MLFWILGYVAVAVAIIIWDAYIGFGFEFPEFEKGPNVICAALAWPLGLPIILMISFGQLIGYAKERRLEKKKERIRIRIAAEKEHEQILEQIEEEISHVEAQSQNAR